MDKKKKIDFEYQQRYYGMMLSNIFVNHERCLIYITNYLLRMTIKINHVPVLLVHIIL